MRHTRAVSFGVGCPETPSRIVGDARKMTVREANLTAASSAEREPEIMESGGTARLHLTLAITDYDHVRDLVNGVVRAEE